MKYPLVSCIVVTYNSQTYIESCLKALQKVSYPQLEIIVVDNNSSDKTVTLTKKFSSHVKVFKKTTNDGYAGGHNFGIQKAQGKYVFLLNPDTMVTPDFLKPLVNVLEKDTQVAAVQPLVYLTDQPNVINLSGKVTHYLGFDWLRDYQSTKVRPSGEIVSFSGSGILLRKTAVEEIGGLDESYFMYYEDGDLGWRLRLAKYKLWFSAESVIYHDYKFIPDESYQPLKQKLFWAERNRIYTLLKNYSLSTLILLAPVFLLTEMGILAYFTLKGWLGVKLKSYQSLWQARHILKSARQQQHKMRQLEDRDLIQNFESTIEFGLFDHPIVRYVLNPILYLYWHLVWPLI